MIYSFYLISITFVLYSAAELTRPNSQLYEGSPCVKSNTGKSGVCKLMKFCPKAIEDLRQRQQYPQTCSFVKKEPVVCCEYEDDNVEIPVTKKIEIPPKKMSEDIYKVPFNETLSYRKCQEYENPDTCFLYASIVGGSRVLSGEYTHMALIGYGESNNKQWKCGGSLVSERFVLTAGHCLNSLDFGEVKFVRLGVTNKNNTASNEEFQDFLVTQTYTPKDYNPESRYHDIALLKLDRNATFNDRVKPGCVYGEPEIEEDQTPVATGWGAVGFADADSDFLLYIRLKLQPIGSCNATYLPNIGKDLQFGIDPAIQLCAGGRKGEDTCQGDSGGPLQIRAPFECSYWIIGVTSFGKACGISNIPGVYTRVAAYRSWIEKIVWG